MLFGINYATVKLEETQFNDTIGDNKDTYISLGIPFESFRIYFLNETGFRTTIPRI